MSSQSHSPGRPTPQIHDGMRTPRQHMRESRVKASLYAKARGLYDERKARETRLNPEAEDPYKVVFNSKFGAHRIQLSSPKVKTYEDGTKEVVKGLAAQFRNGVFKIPREITCKRADGDCKSELHPACDAWDMLTRLKRHRNYGIGKEFWLMVDAVDDGKVLKIAETLQFLQEDEDGKNVVLDLMSEQEFEAEALASSERPARVAPKPRATATGYVPVTALPEAPVEIEEELSGRRMESEGGENEGEDEGEDADTPPDDEEGDPTDDTLEAKRKGGKKRRPRRPGY